MDQNNSKVRPYLPSERIISLDVLRGVAVLGILIMNIQSFSMIGAAYINPAAYGNLTGINKWVWIMSHLIAADKFMSIFSMLFGAGIVLFSEKAMQKGRKPGPLHYRRNFWLLTIGLIHAYALWYGDILVAYSLCAFLIYLFRKQKPSSLITTAIVFFTIPVLPNILFGSLVSMWPQEAYEQNLQAWKPSQIIVQEEIAAMQGGWIDQMSVRAESAIFMQTFLFLILTFWRVASMMLLGMALFKRGILSAKQSTSFYLRMVIIGLTLGYLLSGFGIYRNFRAGWLMDYSMFVGSIFNYIGSAGVALGYVGIIMLIIKSPGFRRFKRIFAAVGKMAFTNYLLMSLIAFFIFYGSGIGLFGEVERIEQLLFVFVIWAVVLIISPLWLKHFYYGPVEWFWRLLTYGKKQPIKRA